MTSESLNDITNRLSDLLNILSKKWVIEIIVNLLDGHSRFNKLQESIPKISGKELSEKLKMLYEHKIIDKLVLNAIPTVITYHLTEKGDLLRKNLFQLYDTSLLISKIENNISNEDYLNLLNRWELHVKSK